MDSIERQREQVVKFLSALGTHDWDGAVESFTGSAPTFEDVPSNTRFTGKAGIVDALQAFAKAVPDLRIQVSSAIDSPGCSVRELVIIGTHLGSYQAERASGRSVRIACACFFLFDANGRLATERIYFDNDTVLRQMRGDLQPYLPSPLRLAA